MKRKKPADDWSAHREAEELYCLREDALSAAGLDAQTRELVTQLVQEEQGLRRRRQAEGIASAKAMGIRFGRPPIETPPNFRQIVDEFDAGHITLKTALHLCGMSQTTFYCRRRKYREEQEIQEEQEIHS